MTRSFVRTLLIAVCLTAFSASPARCDNWFNFSKWSRKTAPTTTVSNEQISEPAGVATVSDANGSNAADADCNDDFDDGNSRWNQWREGRRERNAQRQAIAEMNDIGPPPCYPAINSSLYPCPRPDVPYEVGQTLITNQAFYPHEMLYCHRYRAIYPPYFYKNTCGLACLPFFPKPGLKGTVVTVKYKSTLPHGFQPPYGAVKCCFSNTQFK